MKHEVKTYRKVNVCRTPTFSGEPGEVRQCSCGRTWTYTSSFRSRTWGWREMTNNKRWLRFFKKEKDTHYEQKV